MSSLETLSIFGLINDASVKDDVMALTYKIETLLINHRLTQKAD